MRGAHRRVSDAVAVALLLTSYPCAFALNPALDISQYAHTSWRYRDGFAKSVIHDIAQAPDGYLWLGTDSGPLRFDGVQTVAWQQLTDQPLPSQSINRMVAGRDGTLWLGTPNGLASWGNGKLTVYPELAGSFILMIIEDHEGSIWISAFGSPNGKLCEIRTGSVRCHPEIPGLGHGVFGLYEDAKGYLWVGLTTGVWRWKPGPRQFYPVPLEQNGVQGIVTVDDGATLISTTGGIRRLTDGKSEVTIPLPVSTAGLARNILADRDGGLWVQTFGKGLVHIHRGRTDVFTQADGLTSDHVTQMFEDREGDIWVSTVNGLDRFRELPVVTYSTSQGIPYPSAGMLAARDGSIWLDTVDGLTRLDHGQVTLYHHQTNSTKADVHEIQGSGLPDRGLASLFQDSRGRIWVSSFSAIGYLENQRFIPSAAPGGQVFGLGEDSAGNLWIAYQDRGLLRLSPHNEIQLLSWEKLGRGNPAYPVPDPVHGGVWLGFLHGGLVVYLRDGQVRASYSAAHGLGSGRISDLRFGPDGALWIATHSGLSRLKDGRVATLTASNGLPCETVLWTLEDNARSLWLGMPCGLVKIERSELDAWAHSPGNSGQTIHPTVFDSSDGAKLPGSVGGITPHAGKTPDGKLWFATTEGLSVLDPRLTPDNTLPPPIRIEQIVADRKNYHALNGNLALPPLLRDLAIDYTALSFSAPEKVRFRYKLEGHDRDWQDVGNRRQAFFNDLPPRHYRFRVQACNNSGIWNEAGAFVDFSVAPTLYQTRWFQALCLVAFATALALLFQWRIRYLSRQFEIRTEARVDERTRIARDLHDTLLQSFQGLLLKFHSITYDLPDRPAEAQKTLESAIEQARQAITEGRDAIQGLRSCAITSDLAQAITVLGEEVGAHLNGDHPPNFSVQVEGTPRDLAPLLQDDVYRIAGEALRNAFRHSQARRIEVEIRYDERRLRLRIRDDGKGIDPKFLGAAGRAGHFGLAGMHERAKLLGAKLAVWSEIDSGAEVELTVPAATAYARPTAARWSLFRKKDPVVHE